MRQVSKEEFYNHIGNQDAVVGKPQGTYPYTSYFKLRNGRTLGEVRDRLGTENEPYLVSEYFIKESE